jgi:heme exporter protein C
MSSTIALTGRATGSGTGTRGTRALGIAALIALGWLVAFGLVFSPNDYQQGTAVRFLYLHVPAVTCAYLGFTFCAFGSAMVLRRLSQARVPGATAQWAGWDRFAGACAELGLLNMAINLFTGALWGKKTWGVYWTWDARLTTSALLFLLFLGYVAVRGLDASAEGRARRSAYVGLFAAANIPIVNQSVKWWRSLHQGSTLSRFDVQIDGLMLFSVFVGMIAFALVFVWMLLHRLRLLQLEDLAETTGLESALAERQREGAQ